METLSTVDDLFTQYENSKEKLSDHIVRISIIGLYRNLTDHILDNETWADQVAFTFASDQEERQPWGTYFGPVTASRSSQGELIYYPNPAAITPEIVNHWMKRADSLNHPVLKARYADLVWDIGKRVLTERPDIRYPQLAIDGYIESVQGHHNAEKFDDKQYLIRALQLATLIRDAERSNKAKEFLISQFYAELEEDGDWMDIFKALISNKKCGLEKEEKHAMVTSLEALVSRYTNTESSHAQAAERVASVLLPIYSSEGNVEANKRLSLSVSEAFEKIAEAGSRMQAMGFLQTAIDYSRRTGDQDRTSRLQILREEAIRQSSSEMQTITCKRKIRMEEVDKVLLDVIDDKSWQQTLFNIAAYFIMTKRQLQCEADHSAKHSFVMSLFPISLLAEDHVAAQIGGPDDAEGPLFRSAEINRQAIAPFLSRALDSAIERHELSAEELAAFIFNSSLFSDFPLVLAGVKGWLESDYVKCMFVLVPQIEEAFRNLARGLGESVTTAKKGQKGWEVSMNLGHFLAMDSVKEEIGEDIHFWIKSIFADPRGLNLRNRVAHCLINREWATYPHCDLIIHALLVLGVYKDVKRSCAIRPTQNDD